MRALGVVLGVSLLLIIAAGAIGHISGSTSDEIHMTTAMARATAAAIQIEGYACPAAKMAFRQGPEPLGDAVKVYCGPDDGSAHSYEKLVYRLIYRPKEIGGWVVEPW